MAAVQRIKCNLNTMKFSKVTRKTKHMWQHEWSEDKWQHNECLGGLGSCLAGWAQICHCVQADYGCGEGLFLSLWIPNIIVYCISPRTTCALYLSLLDSSFISNHTYLTKELTGEGLPVHSFSPFWIHLSSEIISQQEFNNRWRTTSAPLLLCSPPSCSRSTLPCRLALDQSSAFSLKVFLRHELLILDGFFFLSKECPAQTKLSNWRCPLLPWLLLSTMQTSTRWQKQRLIFHLASLLKKEKFKS